MARKHEGPYVAAAIFCDKLLKEEDGVLSAVRIVDRVIRTVKGPRAPEEMTAFPFKLGALISLKSGTIKGKRTITWGMTDPNGKIIGRQSFDVVFQGEQHGVQLQITLNTTFTIEGVYWFEVTMGNKMLTRMPLQVVYERITSKRVPNQAP
ncbi:MAG: hypothetical protein A2Z21_02135 [Candidatus Fraserbacteria bacterium RBG_16_55_9]|uniref:Uncharacterized protein n=1 Tax=Fraserbacteria sp. (strain RBG_16_55_9) TaxID=1817864 RepID=A0A1F5V1M8_FRAXR|nr:MAG: hypothetical protein A2Z21_02135 [Candidatus Fraserbacteria bacterium RBG_16_55_9]